jgi:predicted metal-dependent hydrolase
VTEPLLVAYGTRSIAFAVEYRDRATLDIAVHPDGSVAVTAPATASNEQIETRVRQRARWIVAQQRYFEQFRPRTTPRQWVPGETHLYLGRQYRLKIGDPAGQRGVRRSRGHLLLDGIPFDDSDAAREMLLGWYRDRAHSVFPERMNLCIGKFGEAPISPSSLVVRSMTTRWASMSELGRLSINPSLMRAPIDAIDYVITHELAHRIKAHHGPEFWALLGLVMPDHAARKSLLERTLA